MAGRDMSDAGSLVEMFQIYRNEWERQRTERDESKGGKLSREKV